MSPYRLTIGADQRLSPWSPFELGDRFLRLGVGVEAVLGREDQRGRDAELLEHRQRVAPAAIDRRGVGQHADPRSAQPPPQADCCPPNTWSIPHKHEGLVYRGSAVRPKSDAAQSWMASAKARAPYLSEIAMLIAQPQELRFWAQSVSIFCTVRRVLVVDDEENLRLVLRTLLRRHGYEVETAASGEEALALVDSFGPDFVLTDVRMPKMGGLDLLATLKAKGNDATVIVMSAYGNIDLAIEAMKAGAYDYCRSRSSRTRSCSRCARPKSASSLRRENRALREEIRKEHRFEDILAKSPNMQDIFRTIAKIADYKTTVLITGESGVGKELVARAIHQRSSRRGGPFVAVNCGAIPENLLESELFGHKKGAFTDAVQDRRGLFEEATSGTLFLDEIGELPLGAAGEAAARARRREDPARRRDARPQGRRAHRRRHAPRPDGGDQGRPLPRGPLLPPQRAADPRAAAARAARGHPAARSTTSSTRNNTRLGTSMRGLDTEARRLLYEYAWPGNVRELENTIERAMVLCEGDQIGAPTCPSASARRAIRCRCS